MFLSEGVLNAARTRWPISGNQRKLVKYSQAFRSTSINTISQTLVDSSKASRVGLMKVLFRRIRCFREDASE